MEKSFLPPKIGEKNVYAGFWHRLFAGVLDFVLLLPFLLFFAWLEGLDRNLAILVTVPSTGLFAFYYVFFNARFGGTLGKLSAGIRITQPDGGSIGWPEAWLRSSVDLAFALVLLCANIWALAHIAPAEYSKLAWVARTEELQRLSPAWLGIALILQQIWAWGELVVLLLNKRKRAIHDFIAGTVVIRKEFLRSAVDS